MTNGKTVNNPNMSKTDMDAVLNHLRSAKFDLVDKRIAHCRGEHLLNDKECRQVMEAICYIDRAISRFTLQNPCKPRTFRVMQFKRLT